MTRDCVRGEGSTSPWTAYFWPGLDSKAKARTSRAVAGPTRRVSDSHRAKLKNPILAIHPPRRGGHGGGMGKQRLAGVPLDETEGPMAAREEGKITREIWKTTKVGRKHVYEPTHGRDWLPVSGRESVDRCARERRGRTCERRGPPGRQLGSRPADRSGARAGCRYLVVHGAYMGTSHERGSGMDIHKRQVGRAACKRVHR